MKLTIVKSCIDDWWVIERAEHDNTRWIERINHDTYGCDYHMYSGRFSDYADVEGPTSEMLEIARAIKDRGSESFKRCAVQVLGDKVFFESPRNSERPGECTLAEADDLANEILWKLTSA